MIQQCRGRAKEKGPLSILKRRVSLQRKKRLSANHAAMEESILLRNNIAIRNSNFCESWLNFGELKKKS